MVAIIKDLIKYNREFAIGIVLVSIVVLFSLLSLFSPVDPTIP